jgi:hypothetical protein
MFDVLFAFALAAAVTAVAATAPTGPIDGLTGYFDITAVSSFVEKSGSFFFLL